MSLFSSLQLAGNTLNAAQVGIQVTGNNIANASTPGYLRQELVLTPAQTQKKGDLLLGTGVQISGVVQKIDKFLESRLHTANSDLANGATQEAAYRELELVLGELSDTDLSTALTNFFGSIQDVLNQPESTAVRNLSVLEGQKLADDIRRLYGRVDDLRVNLNQQVASSSDDINRLLKDVADLNFKIVSIEGGATSRSDAVGLRDQRQIALTELSGLISIRAVEQEDGQVTVFTGGDFLVFDSQYRKVETVYEEKNGISAAQIQIVETAKKIDDSSGQLAGLTESRDNILGGFLTQLDDFASQLISEFNKSFSQGQGLSGYGSITSEFAVENAELPLDQAGLAFTPTNGSFALQVKNKQSGVTNTTDIQIDLDGLDQDTSLSDLAAALNAVDGVTAKVSPSRKLEITSDSPDIEFAFSGDNSGVLAALGVNHFFSGTGAGSININQTIRKDPGLFAASSGGVGVDTANAEKLASLLDRSLPSADGKSLAEIYDRLAANTSQGASVSRAVADGFRVFQQTLDNQKLSISGVNLDEEAINLITYQRAYQASARYISTVSDLLDVLVNL
ncbi:flagellar hook-associated protein FlgK [Lignipirellula cremea]|uniref:Flagellar hook-associated protein 1 n=1 Tax=Lignipirellula cremea TaxID=2528010 RepID=A0A518DR63_9BACT|nr:flagellar hook-associated protein FlgK [Lignipirellula cremea]QDU94312.1 Flagellar hook-associated protein 1 [Lignipirellula cremea]